MDKDQWEIVRRNHDDLKARERDLMRLLNEARQALPADHSLQPNIRQALGLSALAAEAAA